MTKALDLSIAKTKQRFEQHGEDLRFERGGFGHTAEFAAAIKDGLPARLAAHIRKRLTTRDDYGIRIVAPDELAVEGLGALLHSIVTEGEEPGRSIEVGRRLQGAVWAAGLVPPRGDGCRRSENAALESARLKVRATAMMSGQRRRGLGSVIGLCVVVWRLRLTFSS